MRRARSEAPLKYRMQYAIIAAEDDAMEGHAMKVTRMLQPYTVIFAMGMLSVSLLEGLVWQRSKIPVIALLAVFVIWIFATLPTFREFRVYEKARKGNPEILAGGMGLSKPEHGVWRRYHRLQGGNQLRIFQGFENVIRRLMKTGAAAREFTGIEDSPAGCAPPTARRGKGQEA